MRSFVLFIIILIFSGCSNDNDKNKFYKTEGYNFHFDLSEINLSSEKPVYLHVNGATYPLTVHNSDSYQTLIDNYDSLDFAKEEDVTHFVPGVKLKAGSVNHLYLTEGDPRFDPDHKLLFSFYHFEAEQTATSLKTTDSDDNNKYACAVSSAVSMIFNHPELVTDDPEKAAIIMRHIDPVDPDKICDPKAPHRQEIIDLAMAINNANNTDGSVINEPLTDESQNNLYWVKEDDDTSSLIMFKDEKPYYVYRFTDDEEPSPLPFTGDLSTKSVAVQYRPVDAVLNAAQPALLIALNETKNDPALENIKYSVIEGDGAAESESIVVTPYEEATSLQAKVNESDEKIVLSKKGGIDGMSIYLDNDEVVTDEDGFRYMTVKVKNYYLRHVALWVKWKTPDGDYDTWWDDYLPKEDQVEEDYQNLYSRMGMQDWLGSFYYIIKAAYDSSQPANSLFWGFVSNRTVMLGIPLSPDWTYFKIPIPPTSSSAELIFASMGTGQWYNENIPGAILTSIVDLGIPAYFLVSGIRDGVDGEPILKDALTDPTVITAIVSVGLAMGIYGESRKDGANNYAPYAKALGSILVNTGCDRLRYAIIKAAAESEAENGIPFIGWGLYLAGLAANTSQLTQTVAEVSSTPAIHRNGLAATWSPKVRIIPDPLNIRGGFPESAVKYEAYVHFSDHDTKHLSGKIGNTAVSYLDFTFLDIPEGGEATIKIDLISESGFVSGYVNKKVVNTIKDSPADENGVNFTIQLTENMVNITDKTEYIHKDRIGLDKDGKYVWLGYSNSENNYIAPASPEKTVTSLNCSSSEGGLCSINDITLNIKGNSVGYSWQAYSENRNVCGDSTATSGQRYSFENLSLLNNEAGGPEALHVEPDCNYLLYRPALVYSLTGETDGNNVFVYPQDVEGETHYFVQKISIDSSLSFERKEIAVGELTLPPTDMAITPSGYLISINRALSKMEILDLNSDEVSLADAPDAVLTLGKGSREGLIDDPVAVAVSENGDIFILEQSNSRISAFDINGSVRRIFGDETDAKNYFMLDNADSSAVFLDIDVESTGMIFVLYYENGGKSKDDYHVRIYSKKGELIDTVQGIAAAKMAVDHFRNIFTLNYETIMSSDNIEKPSISMWIPLP